LIDTSTYATLGSWRRFGRPPFDVDGPGVGVSLHFDCNHWRLVAEALHSEEVRFEIRTPKIKLFVDPQKLHYYRFKFRCICSFSDKTL
jgi:hypothetical protein